MPQIFNAQDWYWTVADQDASLVYSSARNIYVDPSTDVDYGNWITRTGLSGPYPANTEADVWYYTQAFQPAWYWDTTTSMMSQPGAGQWYKGQLDNYNALTRFNHVNEGMIAAGVPVKTDDYSRGLIQGALAAAQADPTFTTKWYGSDDNFYTLDAAQTIEMATTVGNHTNSCYTVFASVNQDILTNVITQPSDIDAAYVGL
jgi:hypothetical protein